MDLWGCGRGISRGRVNVVSTSQDERAAALSAPGPQSRAKQVALVPSNAHKPGSTTDDKSLLHRAEQNFREASIRQQDAIKRHVALAPEDESDNMEEEGGTDSLTLLASVLKDFTENGEGECLDEGSGAVTGRGRGDLQANLGRTHGYLEAALSAEGCVCLVCLETIKRTAPMWNCKMCYCMFHMQCIQRWIKEGSYQKVSPLSEELFPNRSAPWFCPKCRHEYAAESAPSRYYCYCGRVADPAVDPWLMPHSCGQPCGQSIRPVCGHKCLLLCHPGPCPPCPKTVEVACYCGAERPMRRRCGTKEWSCGRACGRPLGCGLHSCDRACHAGACPPCSRISLRKCNCGGESAVKPCSEITWKCAQLCGRRLSCGQHLCEQQCHSGACGVCPRSGQRTCPCGRTTVADISCTDEVPACGDTCGRLLECSKHRCMQKCHYGSCGQCLEVVKKRCHCGAAREKELPCYKPWSCDVKCQQMRACGRHACKRRCCSGTACPPCEQLCGRTLACRNHRCSSGCHVGPCYPCPLTVDVKCFCGATKLTVPCGGERVAKPPKCDKPCRLVPECHHVPRPKAASHRCHFGNCPPCKQVCDKPLSGCQHRCPDVCHSALRLHVQPQADRVGPWQPLPEAKLQVVDQPCLPCQVPTPVTCLGGHETCHVPCSQAKSSSCLRKCGRVLACGNHICALDCHSVQVASENKADGNTKAGVNCQPCEEPCSRPRACSCEHSCLLPCHLGDCPPCSQLVRTRCNCSLFVKYIECSKWTAATDAGKAQLRACESPCPKEMPCGHACGLTCHAGPCSTSCAKKTYLYCPCKRKKESQPCAKVQAGLVKISCDDLCVERKRKTMEVEQEAERTRLEEQHRKEQAELELYEHKMGKARGKRRRQRPSGHDTAADDSAWRRWGKRFLAAAVGLAVAAAAAGIAYVVSQ